MGQAAPVEELCDYHRELSRDVLTHAYNRSFFESHLLQQMEADGVLLLDLDHFGTINETYGRQAGDIAIRTVVGAVSACVRSSSDALVRYGDDEFLLLFPHISPHIFAQRAEEIRASVEAIRLTDLPRPAPDGLSRRRVRRLPDRAGHCTGRDTAARCQADKKLLPAPPIY